MAGEAVERSRKQVRNDLQDSLARSGQASTSWVGGERIQTFSVANYARIHKASGDAARN